MIENELLEYIESHLDSQYEQCSVLRETDVSTVIVYTHKSSGKKLVYRESMNRNDDIYRALKGQHSPHLPKIYEVCSDDERLIVLEEFIEGKTLLDLLNNESPDKHTVCEYALQLCDALLYLHANNIIHRDIKPSNVIVKPDGTVVLVDLSIARMISEIQEKDTQMLGTVGYAAPEQFGISQSGKSTDIYALGVLLNIMLTGIHPTIETANGRLGKIIEKATAIQISKRYQDAAKLQKALRKAQRLGY